MTKAINKIAATKAVFLILFKSLKKITARPKIINGVKIRLLLNVYKVAAKKN